MSSALMNEFNKMDLKKMGNALVKHVENGGKVKFADAPPPRKLVVTGLTSTTMFTGTAVRDMIEEVVAHMKSGGVVEIG